MGSTSNRGIRIAIDVSYCVYEPYAYATELKLDSEEARLQTALAIPAVGR
jgi:hypothetical protein